MQKLKMQIEGQLQEIVFFFSLLLSFSVFISGVFSLALTSENVIYILGHFGASANLAIFHIFGYGFFYFAVMALHMGYVTNFHVFKLNDFKREYRVLAYSAIAHIIILTILSTLLATIQIYLEIPSGEVLSRGAGGMLGNAFGQLLYSGLGLYGSIIALLLIAFVTAIMAGFFQLPDVLSALKEASTQTKSATLDGARAFNHSLLQSGNFLLKNYKLASAQAATSSKQWMHDSYQSFSDKIHAYVTSIEGEPEKKKSIRKATVRKEIKETSQKNLEKIAKETSRKSEDKVTKASKKKINVSASDSVTKPVVAERKARKKSTPRKSTVNKSTSKKT